MHRPQKKTEKMADLDQIIVGGLLVGFVILIIGSAWSLKSFWDIVRHLSIGIAFIIMAICGLVWLRHFGGWESKILDSLTPRRTVNRIITVIVALALSGILTVFGFNFLPLNDKKNPDPIPALTKTSTPQVSAMVRPSSTVSPTSVPSPTTSSTLEPTPTLFSPPKPTPVGGFDIQKEYSWKEFVAIVTDMVTAQAEGEIVVQCPKHVAAPDYEGGAIIVPQNVHLILHGVLLNIWLYVVGRLLC